MKRLVRLACLLAGLAVLLPAGAVLLPGCTVSLVADHDQQSEEGVVAGYAQVCRFYDDLAAAAPAARTYPAYAERYAGIATELRVLLLRQKARAKNTESEQIVANILEAWESTRERHRRFSEDPERAGNPYPDSVLQLDREQFDAQFEAAAVAERAKR